MVLVYKRMGDVLSSFILYGEINYSNKGVLHHNRFSFLSFSLSLNQPFFFRFFVFFFFKTSIQNENNCSYKQNCFKHSINILPLYQSRFVGLTTVCKNQVPVFTNFKFRPKLPPQFLPHPPPHELSKSHFLMPLSRLPLAASVHV